ncbi:MAG: caspase family protein, partial [Saprospiraceae bacterium]
MRLHIIIVATFLLTSFSTQAENGCISGNCFDGNGTFIYPSGAKYVGQFQSGQIHGEGALYFSSKSKYTKYFGNFAHNYREGEGRLTYKAGHEYFGSFQKGKQSGYGSMRYANGDEYAGNWIAHEPNGYGIYRFAAGDWYEGNFKSGKYDGEGTMNYTDGAKFVGQWMNNQKHGSGNFYSPDGQVISGRWSNGERTDNTQSTNNQTTSVFASNETTTTNYSSVNRDCNANYCESGRGYFNYSDGTKYVGDFRAGQPEGEGTVLYANGDRYEGGWKGHAPHGAGVMNYSTGRRVGANWEYGKPISFLNNSEAAVTETQVNMEVDAEIKIWAVVVGVGRYTHMPALKFTDDDAYQIYAFLKSPEGGALPDRQLKVLIDEDATRQNILSAARETMLKADENDVVMFYFSGHGLEGSFLPVDYDGFGNRVLHTEISDLLEQSNAKHKIVFADACHSGSLSDANDNMHSFAMRKPVYQTLARYYEAFENTSGGTALLLSSKGEEYSLEDRGLRSGVFSHFLVRGLKGAADFDSDKMVTVQELYNYVYSEVREYTGHIQTPT